LKLNNDKLLSIFAFKFNLRRYIMETNAYMAQSTLAYQKEIMRLRSIVQATVGQCDSQPVLRAPGFCARN
jgi:hypothetical protein